jgi:hypothetical protein
VLGGAGLKTPAASSTGRPFRVVRHLVLSAPLALAGCGSTTPSSILPSPNPTPNRHWDILTAASGTFGSAWHTKTLVAQARGDGVYRIYNNGLSLPTGDAPQYSQWWDHTVNEFSYENGVWTRTLISNKPGPGNPLHPYSTPSFERFFVADARGDGKPRIYAPNNGCLGEACSTWWNSIIRRALGWLR